MTRKNIAKYLNPWMHKREQKRIRFEALRERDGDKCWRCKRPMRFDLPPEHDLAPTIEHLEPKANGGTNALNNLCLCHSHCNRLMGDNTLEVKERLRVKADAEQRAKSRKRRKKAA